MTRSEIILLKLVARAINDDYKLDLSVFDAVNWPDVTALAVRQGVLAIVMDAISTLPKEKRPTGATLYNAIAQVVLMEKAYQRHKNEIRNLANFYAENGYMMMLLKGYGLSSCWPIPEHRPVGDIDIFLGRMGMFPAFGKKGVWKEADKVVKEKLNIIIDNTHHHHTVFTYGGISVENHFDFINAYDHFSSHKMERLFKFLVSQAYVQRDECKNLYYPSDDFNALFILKHCSGHFASTEVTLRHLLDWLLFIRKHHDSIDWELLCSRFRKYGLKRLASIFSTIGVKYLGMRQDFFHDFEKDEGLVCRVLGDILSPEFSEHEDGTLLSGLWVKPRRFWHNRWKHRLCYSDSFVSGFIWTSFAKMLKPRHFKV